MVNKCWIPAHWEGHVAGNVEISIVFVSKKGSDCKGALERTGITGGDGTTVNMMVSKGPVGETKEFVRGWDNVNSVELVPGVTSTTLGD